MTDYPAVLTALHPGAQWSMGEDYASLVWHDDTPKPTKRTLDAAWPQVQYDRAYKQTEAARRARYTVETDGMFFAAQRDGDDLTAWKAAVDQIKTDLPYPVAP